ncbi:hypothetical protein [Streptomyces sp. H27-H5]|uniref:hypothetical protein n=1 Tax=Streptomyces sp. H27-H5 TaxID=2996460 RepID=UPI00226EB177|nr:hypothetical protein [Streptomyces sp. H27-H5]MCY0963013.1 hypothetical protein [Streptomyces sp. H27-H5]
MTALPGNLELQKLLAAGSTHAEIAQMFGVERQAVTKRVNGWGEYKKGENAPVTASMPWRIADRPDKVRLTNQAAYRGLRLYLGWRLGEDRKPLSERAKKDLRLFLEKINNGLVLTLDDSQGFVYVDRTPEDGRLVVRWPEGVKRDEKRSALLSLPNNKLTMI